MYFDRRLWALTRGLRGQIGLSILIGLGAAAFGIARFTLLGLLLALVFTGGSGGRIAMMAAGVAAVIAARCWRGSSPAPASPRLPCWRAASRWRWCCGRSSITCAR